MPNWKIHIEIAKRLKEELEYVPNDYELFLLGSILPDINNAYSIKDVSKEIPHRYTHYRHEEKEMHLTFLKQYGNQVFHNPLLFGYFTHLYTDYFWNIHFKEKAKKNPALMNLSKVELRIIKQIEFRSYNNNYIGNCLDIKHIKRCVKACKEIDRISIQEEDIEKTIEFLKVQKLSTKVLKYYTKEELDGLLKETIQNIIDFHKNVFYEK